MGIFHREEQEYRISKLSGILSEDSTSLEDYIYNRPSKKIDMKLMILMKMKY